MWLWWLLKTFDCPIPYQFRNMKQSLPEKHPPKPLEIDENM
jgi:hypothetical protein